MRLQWRPGRVIAISSLIFCLISLHTRAIERVDRCCPSRSRNLARETLLLLRGGVALQRVSFLGDNPSVLRANGREAENLASTRTTNFTQKDISLSSKESVLVEHAISSSGNGESIGRRINASVVTPWEVGGGGKVDYEKLVEQFGCARLTEDVLGRLEELAKRKLPEFLRRGLGVSHRDLEKLLAQIERGDTNFYVYTGRGASSNSLHLGHIIPFQVARWFQQAFNAPVVIQLTDDEKFLWKKDIDLPTARKLAWENAKDIIALGFNPDRTFIFRNTDYISQLYSNVIRIQKLITYSQASSTLGLNASDCIGKTAFPAIQAAPAFSTAFVKVLGLDYNRKPLLCVVPCAIDQDPFFRLARDVATKLKEPKPVLLHTRFVPSLQGVGTKASSSIPSSTVFLSDSQQDIKKKIMRAKSGGQESLALHRQLGADLDEDVAFQYLRYFHPNDTRLEEIAKEYSSGGMLSGTVKEEAVSVVATIIAKFQERREQVTNNDVREFMRERVIVDRARACVCCLTSN
mmetsp:Transcript_22633/g.35537  ORF Transcript_22633/g.35537 Transcript_22633/m.35537 type:complete len:519 (-) Transcript_22633:50-1606(-)